MLDKTRFGNIFILLQNILANLKYMCFHYIINPQSERLVSIITHFKNLNG